MTAPIELIIDCDPGIDDALALWLAAANPQALNLRAVTAVAGNRPVDVTCANAIRLLDAAGLGHVPVYRGAEGPLDAGPARSNLVHGADGLGGVDLPLSRGPRPAPAWQALLQAVEERPPHSITLATLGPLTNVALAERQRPGTLARLRRLVMMGGAVHCPGNVTPRAEFNFHADPEAARVVLHAGVAEVELFGLDVTRQVVMDGAWLDSLSGLPGRCAAAARDMLRAYSNVDPLLHDACPVAALLDPRLFGGELRQLDVDTGRGDSAGQVRSIGPGAGVAGAGVAQVHVDVQAVEVLTLVRDALRRLP